MLKTRTKEQNDSLWSLGQKLLGEKDRDIYLSRLDQQLEKYGIGLIFMEEDGYPSLLRQIEKPPEVLFYRGNLSLASRPCLAVVGTRRATAYGEKAAYEIAKDAASQGFAVVSGMARGIDSCAHKGALDAGGATVALMPAGLDQCYPPSNAWLFERICSEGLALSEYPPSVRAEKWFFLNRNRLISGLSLGTVVVQAGGRSGAINTAQHAAEQGRDVFAVPGSIFEFGSVGVHRLIQDGAWLVTSVHSVTDFYRDQQLTLEDGDPPEKTPARQNLVLRKMPEEIPAERELTPEANPAGEWQWLYDQIDGFGSLPEQLCERTGRSPQMVQTGLTMLELNGLIERRERQRIYRK